MRRDATQPLGLERKVHVVAQSFAEQALPRVRFEDCKAKLLAANVEWGEEVGGSPLAGEHLARCQLARVNHRAW